MVDTEKFIECVKNNPTIWKKTAKGYGDKLLREKTWNMIGQQMFSEWNEMPEAEKLDEVKNMKNKWRHMRDGFNKYINQGKGRFSGVRKKRYIYADNLSFLLQRGSRYGSKGPEAIDEKTENPLEVDDKSNQHISEQIESTKKPISRRFSQRVLTNKQQQLVKKNVGQMRIDDDPDRCYLLSLLPEFKKLNDDEKLDFRFHILQFFRVIRSKRSTTTTHSSEFANGWNENDQYQLENGERDISRVYVKSPFHSPRASQDSSFPNSPQDSANSNSSFTKNSPPLVVKTELI